MLSNDEAAARRLKEHKDEKMKKIDSTRLDSGAAGEAVEARHCAIPAGWGQEELMGENREIVLELSCAITCEQSAKWSAARRGDLHLPLSICRNESQAPRQLLHGEIVNTFTESWLIRLTYPMAPGVTAM